MARNKHNAPAIIKYPFWQMTYQNPEAFYACVNYGEAYAPKRSWNGLSVSMGILVQSTLLDWYKMTINK